MWHKWQDGSIAAAGEHWSETVKVTCYMAHNLNHPQFSDGPSVNGWWRWRWWSDLSWRFKVAQQRVLKEAKNLIEIIDASILLLVYRITRITKITKSNSLLISDNSNVRRDKWKSRQLIKILNNLDPTQLMPEIWHVMRPTKLKLHPSLKKHLTKTSIQHSSIKLSKHSNAIAVQFAKDK